ncbi:MAG: flagellin, partial [Candidatus Nanopelagicales bacterium]
QRMNELGVHYNNGVNNPDSKAALKNEFDTLKTEIGRTTDNTSFNGVKLFDSANSPLSFQVGYASSDKIDVNLETVDVSSLDIASTTVADDVQGAITNISTSRGNLGALQNRFEHTINNLNVAVENLSASESRIRDTDMASEMVNFTRSQILSQAGTSMLSQATQAPQSVLKLLG